MKDGAGPYCGFHTKSASAAALNERTTASKSGRSILPRNCCHAIAAGTPGGALKRPHKMTTIKPLEGYTAMSDDDVASIGAAVVTGLTGNSLFLNPLIVISKGMGCVCGVLVQ